MNSPIKLPRLLGFRLEGFQPIFKKAIEMRLDSGPYIILGGNGLGKTTLMQAIIFGLTGGNMSFEEENPLRWDHNFFKRRLDSPELGFIEIDLALGEIEISIRRGFRGSKILAYKDNLSIPNWVENHAKANDAFENAVTYYGGYRSTADFSFIIHRLMYLPETRRLLAWDDNAQIRTLMLLNQDALSEEKFRSRREKLKNIDSEKRHIRVVIGKIEEQIKKLEGGPEDGANNKKLTRHQKVSDWQELIKDYQKISKQRSSLENDRAGFKRKLNDISNEIEKIRERIEEAESAIISRLLLSQEKANSLVLNRMAEKGICPACGVLQHVLKINAEKNLQSHKCVLCGSAEPQKSQPELSTLQSQLSEKVRSQQVLEKEFYLIDTKLKKVNSQADELQFKINKARLSDPNLTLLERGETSFKSDDPYETKIRLTKDWEDLEYQFQKLKIELEQDYKEFKNLIDGRLSKIREKYIIYATEFLGIRCELAEAPVTDLMTFENFVPMFDGKVREKPETCSEAQRFFLDIAYKLALLDFATGNEKSKVTFLCETPETALDISYIDNVVDMFEKFIKNGHSLLITSNIQTDSIAGKLLKKNVKKGKRESNVLNLLKLGRLSEVHKKALNKLNESISRILG